MSSDSLCDLGELYVSVVDLPTKPIHHRGTEATEDCTEKDIVYFPGRLQDPALPRSVL
jgi:hypothetical protein